MTAVGSRLGAPRAVGSHIEAAGLTKVGNYVPGSYSRKMARATRNVDIKLQFEQFDMMPGPIAKRFQRNLLIHGGKSDTQGFSITDCFLRVDAFAVAYGQSIVLPAPAGTVAAPGAAPGPAAGVGIVTARQARKARLKESFSFLIMHITDQSTLDLSSAGHV